MRKTFLFLIFITSFLVCAFTHTVANTYVACDNDSINNDSTNTADTVISIPNIVLTDNAQKVVVDGVMYIVKNGENGVCYDLSGRKIDLDYIWKWQ